ncbi:MAG: S1C family serine protease [Prosthecobacter sp.]
MKLKHTLLLVCLGVSVTPLVAQQPAPPPAAAEGGLAPQPPSSNSRPQQEKSTESAGQKSVGYLGVLTREVPPELRSQFSLPKGFGLMVDEVLPGSPAHAAGLKPYDVLLKLDDQQLVNMEQLMALVRARKKGDTVTLSLITGGKETQVPATLAERIMPESEPQHRPRPQHGPGFSPRLQGQRPERVPGFGGSRDPLPGLPPDHQERIERFQKELLEYQERLQDWASGNHATPIPQPPTLNFPLPRSRQEQRSRGPEHRRDEGRGPDSETRGVVHRHTQSESHASATVKQRDDSGEYTLRKEDDRATFTVRDKDCREQSWPINNEAERKAVPQPYQDKLREMEKGVRIERSGIPPPAETKPTSA